LTLPPPPCSPLFPYTTLFRSRRDPMCACRVPRIAQHAHQTLRIVLRIVQNQNPYGLCINGHGVPLYLSLPIILADPYGRIYSDFQSESKSSSETMLRPVVSVSFFTATRSLSSS